MRRSTQALLATFAVSFALAASCDATGDDRPNPPRTASTTTSETTTTTLTVVDTTAAPTTTTTTLAPAAQHVVTRVVDGDTVDVSNVGRVRLIGIDTPEVYGGTECFGPEASAEMRRLVEGHKVIVQFDDTQGRYDRYDRVLAYLFVGDVNVGEQLIAGGFAEEYLYDQPYIYRADFVIAEMRAQAAHLGLWGAC